MDNLSYILCNETWVRCMAVNKARMTFRFNEDSARQVEVVQEEHKTASIMSDEGTRGFQRLEHKDSSLDSRGDLARDEGNDAWNHRHEMPSAIQIRSESSDPGAEPLNQDVTLNEILPKQQTGRMEEENRLEDGEEYWRYDNGVSDQGEPWRNIADMVYPQLVDVTYRPRRPVSLWKIIGTVTGAVVTGALFGLVLLSFFKDGTGASLLPVKPGTENPAAIQKATVDKAAPVAVQIQGQSYYVLQYGVFSSKERVAQAKKELQQYGIAAESDPDQENRVYAGISPDREQAKLLSSQLKAARGMDLYVREISLPAANELKFGGEAKVVNQYFAVSSEFVSTLCKLSVTLLGQEKPAALTSDQTAAVTDLHSRWMEAIKSLQTGLGADGEKLALQLEQTMNSAISAVTEYNRNASKGLLWEVQSSMMKYVMQQKELISVLEKA